MNQKICPFCGTENELNAVRCQFCNFVFDANKIEPEQDMVSENLNQEVFEEDNSDFQTTLSDVTSDTVTDNYFASESYSSDSMYKRDDKKLLLLIISIVVLIGVTIFFINQFNQKEDVSSILTETKQDFFADSPVTEPATKLSTEPPTQPPTAAPTEPPTQPPTEPRNPPIITCEIKTEKGYEGYSYTLYVNGNYDYYYVDCKEYSGGEPNTPYQVIADTRSASSLYLTAGSSLDHVTATVTPYYSDGTQGQTLTCTANQPKPAVSVSVSSCNKKGEINGRGVAGFTTSYVVNGGAKTTVRDELGDRWHVTAKNYCSAYGITWYELWDSDDGDYYGWVDSSYISFYSGNSSSSSVEVHSFYNYGEIDGYGVPGYTTSYIVNGGSKSTVRDELGNGWHVTAKNYCVYQGKAWYELWDSDDGDYYGWVNGDYIRFYAN